MEPNGTASVQYDRWNEDNINMNVEASQSTAMKISNRVCVGRIGIAVKTAGALAALAVMFIVGYMTGYFIHKC